MPSFFLVLRLGNDRDSRIDAYLMYEAYFGFSEFPFNVTPDPRFFFPSTCYQEAFATLRYGVERRKGFVVVTGEGGTGKTTLLRKLMQDRDPNLCTAYIFNSLLSFTELLKVAMSNLGLPKAAADKASMIEQLNDYLIRQLQSKALVCLLIDEAQNLTDETLEEIRLLSNFETEKEKLLQIVLAGQPELERKLNQPNLTPLRQRVALRCRLRPLDPQEVGLYIDARLKTAGYLGSDLFSPEAVERIISCSKGIPRLINLICDHALFNAYATSKSQISADMIQDVAWDLSGYEQPQSAADSGLSEFKRAMGEHTFRATHKTIPSDVQEIGQPNHDFGCAISSGDVWPVGFDLPRKTRWWRGGVAVVIAALIVLGVAASLHSRGVTLSVLRKRVEQFAGVGPEDRSIPSTNAAPKREPLRATETDSKEQLPTAELIPPSEEPRSDNVATDLQGNPRDRVPRPTTGSPATQDPAKIGESQTLGSDRAKMKQLPNNDESAARRFTIEIYRAIHNRAIMGVNVYISRGAVYLGGRVATQRQKRAAVQAAESVPGVGEVRDQIAVAGAGGRGLEN
jgi:general secretion pathway protein A